MMHFARIRYPSAFGSIARSPSITASRYRYLITCASLRSTTIASNSRSTVIVHDHISCTDRPTTSRRFFAAQNSNRHQSKLDADEYIDSIGSGSTTSVGTKSTSGSLRSSTTYHALDGLDRREWTLIYHDREYERTKNMIPPLIIFGVVIVLFFTFAIILVYPDREKLQLGKADLLFLGWPIGVGLVATVLIKKRRRFVLRIYEQKPSSGSTMTEKKDRRYCLIGLNWYLRRRRYPYDISETSQAHERHKAIGPYVGNYKVKNRSWYVKAEYFDRPTDYFNVRVRS